MRKFKVGDLVNIVVVPDKVFIRENGSVRSRNDGSYAPRKNKLKVECIDTDDYSVKLEEGNWWSVAYIRLHSPIRYKKEK